MSQKRALRGFPEYWAWRSMISRCTNPKAGGYKDYGGRGISVCERWMHSFRLFLMDVGFKPTDDHSIDRIDNDGNYEPGNVRWATRLEQAKNKRPRNCQMPCGEQHPQAKLTNQKVSEIRRLRSEGVSWLTLAEMFSVSTRSIRLIVDRKTWQNVP